MLVDVGSEKGTIDPDEKLFIKNGSSLTTPLQRRSPPQ